MVHKKSYRKPNNKMKVPCCTNQFQKRLLFSLLLPLHSENGYELNSSDKQDKPSFQVTEITGGNMTAYSCKFYSKFSSPRLSKMCELCQNLKLW